MLWEFIELPPFAELRDDLFPDEEFLSLQIFLCEHPDAGDVIPQTGGCRKLRWAARGKGKRGGARVIYFLKRSQGQIILVTAYGKGERDDVPRTWLKRIKEVFDHEQS
ncbi:MAG: toxin HigB-2 [Deltaproteobacteria bacterium]|jgi:mRNA-degrading endonuclease RelE of RelBE toxin-antitoxin system|nr:toxin HigB-2 [Deltaproteobacteria bacterium]